MRIILINLDRAPQRLAFMTEQLTACGLAAERLAAVDGTQTDLTPYQASGLKPGEIGCFLSHRKAWQQIVAAEDDHGVVLEDDVRLSARLSLMLEDLSWLPPSTQLVKLDRSGRTVALEPPGVAVPGNSRCFRLRGEHTGTAGYIVSRHAAADLLARSERFDQPVDLFMFGEAAAINPKSHILQIVPAVVGQEKHFGGVEAKGMQSSITAKASGKRGPVITIVSKELGRWLRKLGKFMIRLPSRARGKRTYKRIPFA